MVARFALSVCLAFTLIGCDSGDSEGAEAPTSNVSEGSFITAPDSGCVSKQLTAADLNHMGPGAGIGGLVLDNNCNPLVNFKVLCCTDDSCVPTDTLEDGRFYMGGIMNEVPRKVRIVGVTHGYYDALVYLPVAGEELTIASKPIVLAPLADYAPLSADAGGDVTLAEGQLEVSVAPGSMKYPLGHFTEDLSAQRVGTELVGPFDTTPWDGIDGAMAYVFDPYDMKVEAPEDGADAIQIAFHAEDHAPPGAVYDLWAADTKDAHLSIAGTATVGEDGVIRTDAGNSISSLHTVVIVPQ